jgi:hypothetical protein
MPADHLTGAAAGVVSATNAAAIICSNLRRSGSMPV